MMMILNKVSAEEADACTQEILEAIDVDKDGDVTKVRRGRNNYILNSDVYILLGRVH